MLASTLAGGAGYFAPSSVIGEFATWASSQGIGGMGMWDSHWDKLNNFNISNTIIAGADTSMVTPTTPTSQSICGASAKTFTISASASTSYTQKKTRNVPPNMK